jgi:hypothetical protein
LDSLGFDNRGLDIDNLDCNCLAPYHDLDFCNRVLYHDLDFERHTWLVSCPNLQRYCLQCGSPRLHCYNPSFDGKSPLTQPSQTSLSSGLGRLSFGRGGLAIVLYGFHLVLYLLSKGVELIGVHIK